jgi:hypothetical protein
MTVEAARFGLPTSTPVFRYVQIRDLYLMDGILHLYRTSLSDTMSLIP